MGVLRWLLVDGHTGARGHQGGSGQGRGQDLLWVTAWAVSDLEQMLHLLRPGPRFQPWLHSSSLGFPSRVCERPHALVLLLPPIPPSSPSWGCRQPWQNPGRGTICTRTELLRFQHQPHTDKGVSERGGRVSRSFPTSPEPFRTRQGFPSPEQDHSPSQGSPGSWPVSCCSHRCSCPRCLRLWSQRLSRRQELAQAVTRRPGGTVTHLRHG